MEDHCDKPYKTDGERIVYIQELFNKTDSTIEQGLVATPLGWSGETNGFMVNGKTISNYGIVDNSTAQLDVIEVEPDKTYQFRFISANSLTVAIFQFEGHTSNNTMQIIEADGGYTQPLPTNILQMGTGQRYSALFKTKTCAELQQAGGKTDYYLQIAGRERPKNITNYAILRYTNTDSCGLTSPQPPYPTNSYPSVPPLTLPPTINGFLDYQLRPLDATTEPYPTAAEVNRRIVLNVQQFNAQYSIWLDANVSWVENATDPLPHTSASEPYLVAMYKNETAYLPNYDAAVANMGVDPSTKTFPAKIGEVIEIVFQQLGAVGLNGSTGGGMDTHPWHAHGAHYFDVGGGDGAFDPTILETQLAGTQPVKRDTTILYRYNATTNPGQKHGWRAWRLRVTEPGVWMVHCHTLQHMIMGMQTVWVFGDTQDILGPAVGELDLQGYLTYGGDVVGNRTHDPEVVHWGESGWKGRKARREVGA